MVLFDDAVVLTHHHPHVSAAQSLTRLPYLFGIAVYAFEVLADSAPHLHVALSASQRCIVTHMVRCPGPACPTCMPGSNTSPLLGGILQGACARVLCAHCYPADCSGHPLQGVGMVLPIEASMASRAHFDLVLSLTMGAITVLYVGFGLVRVRPSAVSLIGGPRPCRYLTWCTIDISII